MRAKIVSVMLLFTSLLPLQSVSAPWSKGPIHDNPPPPFAPDRVLVSFLPGTAASEIGKANRQAGGRTLKVIHGIGVHVIQVPAGTVQNKIALYQANPNVQYVEPDFNRVLIIPNEGQDPPPPDGSGINYFNEQWGLHNTGQFLTDPSTGEQALIGSSDADIDAPEGWDFSTGDSGAVIAILDTGLDVDVDCNNTFNPQYPNLEFIGKCVDAQNFVSVYSNTTADIVTHGTHVAGIAAANTHNGIGIAGVGWDSAIANLKSCYEYEYDVCPPFGCFVITGVCPVSASAEAITYAADHGYHVINMSYASDQIDPATGEPIGIGGPTETESNAVNYAWNKGVVLVAAAGNSNNMTPVYPAAYDEVIAVGATERNDDRASFSTFGNWVTVLAPGENILSTIPNEVCVFYSDILGIPFDPTLDVCLDWYSGTSMASPHVAGAAALVWAHLFPGQAPDQCQDVNGIPCNALVRNHIENGADTVGALGQNLLAWSQHGRLNLAGALADQGPVDNPVGNTAPIAAFTYSCTDRVCSFDGSSASDSDGTISSFEWDFGDGQTGNSSNMSYEHTYLAQGNYTVTLIVTDNEGASSTPAIATFRVKHKGTTAGSADGGSNDSSNTTGEAEKGKKKCSDGIDNDGDSLIDSDDPDC